MKDLIIMDVMGDLVLNKGMDANSTIKQVLEKLKAAGPWAIDVPQKLYLLTDAEVAMAQDKFQLHKKFKEQIYNNPNRHPLDPTKTLTESGAKDKSSFLYIEGQ